MDTERLYNSESQVKLELRKLTFSERHVLAIEVQVPRNAGDNPHFAHTPLVSEKATNDWLQRVRQVFKTHLAVLTCDRYVQAHHQKAA
jgi:hypothetical protein